MLGSLLILHGTGRGRDIDLYDLPKFLLFVANVFPETRNQLDPPLWSLHIEVSFYVVLPLLVCLALVAAGLA